MEPVLQNCLNVWFVAPGHHRLWNSYNPPSTPRHHLSPPSFLYWTRKRLWSQLHTRSFILVLSFSSSTSNCPQSCWVSMIRLCLLKTCRVHCSLAASGTVCQNSWATTNQRRKIKKWRKQINQQQDSKDGVWEKVVDSARRSSYSVKSSIVTCSVRYRLNIKAASTLRPRFILVFGFYDFSVLDLNFLNLSTYSSPL